MIPDDEIIIEDETLSPEDEASLRRILLDCLTEDIAELAKDYPRLTR